MNARDLITQLNTIDEHSRLEAKRASQVGKSVMETVCAFSNEPGLGGGCILLGVEKEEGTLFPVYNVSGVGDPDLVQRDLATQCRSMFNVPITPTIEVQEVEGRKVVLVRVQEAPTAQKPIFFSATGLPRGAYRRIGSADVRCSDDDMAVLYQSRRAETFDSSVLDGTDIADADPDALAVYRRERAKVNATAEELDLDDAGMLQALGCAKRDEVGLRLTLAGLVLFGRGTVIRRLLPMTRVDYIRVPGREWVPSGDTRYETSIEMRGPLMTLLTRAQAAILDDLPRAFNLPEGALQRADQPRLPTRVVREALVNALMHRSYREQEPMQIIRYANRLELRNPGSSLKSEDRLGEPGSEPRNPYVAAVLHELNFAETKGTGIRTMQTEMERAGLSAPHFDSDREANRFKATFLFHHFLTEEDVRWLGRFKDLTLDDADLKALVFLRETGTIDNRVYRELNKVHPADATQGLRRLRDFGLIEARDRTSARYYIPTGRLLDHTLHDRMGKGIADKTQGIEDNGSAIDDSASGIEDKATVSLGDLPATLALLLEALGRRTDPAKVQTCIEALCNWRPLAARDLAALLKRSRRYTSDLVLELERLGRIAPTHPDARRHPDQTYRSTSSSMLPTDRGQRHEADGSV